MHSDKSSVCESSRKNCYIQTQARPRNLNRSVNVGVLQASRVTPAHFFSQTTVISASSDSDVQVRTLEHWGPKGRNKISYKLYDKMYHLTISIKFLSFSVKVQKAAFGRR